MSDEFEVGYRKPPKHSRFKKGRSGDPKGRPKGNRNLKTDVLEALRTPVQVQQDGKPKTISTQRAALLRLRQKALSGDARALDRLLELAATHNNEELQNESAERLSPIDQEILDSYRHRMMRGSQEQPKANADLKPVEDDKDDDDAWLC